MTYDPQQEFDLIDYGQWEAYRRSRRLYFRLSWAVAITIAVITIFLTSCTPIGTSISSVGLPSVVDQPTRSPACEPRGDVVVMVYRDVLGCDVLPGQTLDVRFPGSDPLERDRFAVVCDDMGGHLVWWDAYDDDGEFVCADVDF